MRFFRLNLDTDAEYEAIRASVDSQIGFSGSLTCISPYATAPQDQKGRVLLSLADNQPGYESLLAAFSGLSLVKKAKDLTQDDYDASFFPAPSGSGGGVSSWNDLSDKPSTFAPSAHTHVVADVTGLGTLATQSGTFSGTSSGTNTGDQTFALTGDVTGSGTGTFAATLSASGVTAGTYASVTVNAKGRVTAGTTTQAWSTITSTPTTLAGYGITDAATSTHTHGNLTNAGAIGSTSGQIVVTTTSGVLTTAATIAASAVTGLATVATSGAYADLSGKPTIPTITSGTAAPSGGSDGDIYLQYV